MNEIVIVKEYEFLKPLIHKINSIIDNCYRDCHNSYFHKFENESAYDSKNTNISKIEMVNLANADKSVNLYELKTI